jgi:hypothetical protein
VGGNRAHDRCQEDLTKGSFAQRAAKLVGCVFAGPVPEPQYHIVVTWGVGGWVAVFSFLFYNTGSYPLGRTGEFALFLI